MAGEEQGMIARCALLAVAASLPLLAIEEPPYKVLQKSERFEVRQYESLPLVSTPMGGMRGDGRSFMRLFGYISGNNEGRKKIAMTAPVFMEGDGTDEGGAAGRMSFLIPAEVAEAGSPEPGGKQVSLHTMASGRFAVLRFSGHREEAKRLAAVRSLRGWVKENGWEAEGEPFFAYYDPPGTPEDKRRNEVWLRLAAGPESD